MPIAMECPSCQASFRLDDAMAGKKMKCKKCQHVFVVPKAESAAAPLNMELEDEPASAPAVSAKPAPPQPAAEPGDAIAETPRKVPSKPPPLKKSAPPQRPSVKRRQPASSGSSGMMALLLALLGGGLLVCLGGVCLVGFWSFSAEPAPNPPQPPMPMPGPGPIVDNPKLDGMQPPPPPQAVGIKVAFGPDGVYRTFNRLTQADPVSKFGAHHKLYLVEFQAGKTYQIDLVNPPQNLHFDPYLYLVDDANNIIARDDDGGGGLNARITYRAPRNETLRIIATHLGGLNIGAYSLTIRMTDGVGKTFVANTLQLDGFVARELTLSSNITTPLSPIANEPVWDAQGKAMYWIVNNTLQKVGRDGKLEASVAGPLGAHQLAFCPDGLLAYTPAFNEIHLINPQSLATIAKIPTPANRIRWLVASRTSTNAYAYHGDFSFVDVKTQKIVPAQVNGGPANRQNLRSIALSPDGKHLCVQTIDFHCHFYRVDGTAINHLATTKPPAKGAVYFQFSPDSKYMALTHPNLSPIGAKKMANTEVYATDSWDKPAYTLPGYLNLAAFDTRGGLYATLDKGELRYYATPAVANAGFKTLALPIPLRRLLTPPQGEGCLVLAQQKSFLVEPAPKN